jgi:effector-binding domain-containing protein
VGIGVYYHLNKAYISQKLCENKNNPDIHCNGHCYLTKQLKKAEEGEQKQAQKILKEKEEIISNQVKTLPGKYFPSFHKTDFITYSSSIPVSDYRNDLVKPPAA